MWMFTVRIIITLSEALFALPTLYAGKSSSLAACAPYLDTQKEIFWSLAGAECSQSLLSQWASLELSGAGKIHGW